MALKEPKIKILKNKKSRFFLMAQGVLCQQIRFLGKKKLWPVACGQTDNRMDTEYPIRALAFQSFYLWYSGPISSINIRSTK